jgi:hypothetical protein
MKAHFKARIVNVHSESGTVTLKLVSVGEITDAPLAARPASLEFTMEAKLLAVKQLKIGDQLVVDISLEE